MVDFNAWRGSRTPISAADRAVSLWGIIQRDPTTIVISRSVEGSDDTELDPQTVRVEQDNTAASNTNIPPATVGMTRYVVYGIKDHPTETDTDIQRSDRFFMNERWYEVKTVIPLPGQVQALCEAIQ